MQSIKLFPNRRGSERSCTFVVAEDEMAVLTGYGMPPGSRVCINQIHQNKCECEHREKPYCQIGTQAGLTASDSSAVIAMPGKYVAILCVPEGADVDQDWAVYADVSKAHTNFNTLLQAAAIEDKI